MARFFSADPSQRESFTTTSLHIHQDTTKVQADTLVVFVHGWGGHGYKTWKGLPSTLFQHDTLHADIGLFDYRSGLRRRLTNSPTLNLVVTDLLDELRDLSEYRYISFVCHSMGGVIASAALRRSFERNDGARALPHRVSSLIMLGSPRAGTRLVPWKIFPGKDKEFLLVHSQVADANATFLTNYVDPALKQEMPRTFHVPHFVGLGAADSIVDSFSAGFGIPDAQKRVFRGTHSGFLRHHDLAEWIVSCLVSGRESKSAGLPNRSRSQIRLLTRFEGHSLHGEWQDEYEKALAEFATQSPVPVIDVTQLQSDEPVSIHMRILPCDDVGKNSTTLELLKLKRAHEENRIKSVGLSPHGYDAENRAREIFDLIGSSESRWIKGTEDLAALRAEMVNWLRRTEFLHASPSRSDSRLWGSSGLAGSGGSGMVDWEVG